VKNTVALVQAHTFFLNMVFVAPVTVPYYQEVLGLTYQQFMIGEAVCAATVIVMEVPTGWLSDIWTRRKTMIAGTFANVAGWLTLWLSHGFLGMLLAQATLGLSASLLSGANTALLFESLQESGTDSAFRRVEGMRQAFMFYALGGTAAIGSVLFAANPELPIVATWATSILALGLTLFLRDPQRHAMARAQQMAGAQQAIMGGQAAGRSWSPKPKHPLADVIGAVSYAMGSHRRIGSIVVLSALLFAVTRVMFRLQQPYFIDLNIPVAWFGILSAIATFAGGLGGQFGHRIGGSAGNPRVLTGCFLTVLAACLISGLWLSYSGAALLLTGSFVWGLGWPIVQDILSRNAPPVRRATLLSTASLAVNLFSIPLMLLAGWAATHHGVQSSLIGLAALVALSGGAFHWRTASRSDAP
jgi:MFS family permease